MATINTIQVFALDGSATRFPVNFEYLARKFVQVTLLGDLRRPLTMVTEFVFEGSSMIRTLTAWGPAQGYNSIEIRRVTSASERIVDFNDATVLRAVDLNTAEIQAMHIAEEARNAIADVLGVDADGNLDARFRRVINLADPVGPLDAVNQQTLLRFAADAPSAAIEARAAAALAHDATLTANAAAVRADSLRADLKTPGGTTNIKYSRDGSYSRTLQSRLRESVHLNDFPGADPTGEADSTAAFNLAVAAVGPGGNILMDGLYSIYGEIVMDKAVALVGKDSRTGNAPNYRQSNSCIVARSATAGAAIRVQGVTATFRDFLMVNMTGNVTGDGIRSVGENNSVKAESVIIQGFNFGIRSVQGYYNKISNSTITYCDVCIQADNCYNVYMAGNNLRSNPVPVNLSESYCVSFLDGSSGAIFGGSCESFHGAGVRLLAGSSIGLYTVYFEGQGPNLDAPGVTLGNGCSVTAMNCQVYLTTMGRFIERTDTSALGVRVFSRNNRIIYPTDSKAVTVYFPGGSDPTSSWDVAGDNWGTVGPNVKYTAGNFAGTVGDYKIEFPVGHPQFGVSVDTTFNHMTPALVPPAIVVNGTTTSGYEPPMVLFSNSGFGTDDPAGIHGKYGYEAYWAVYQAGHWEKVGIRLPNIPNATTANVTDTLNLLLEALRKNGAMVL